MATVDRKARRTKLSLALLTVVTSWAIPGQDQSMQLSPAYGSASLIVDSSLPDTTPGSWETSIALSSTGRVSPTTQNLDADRDWLGGRLARPLHHR
jgi:hypothetical protein